MSPRIEKDVRNRAPLEPGLKLAITLRFLATGQSYRGLAFSFRVAHNTISRFIPRVCNAIVEEYRQEQFTTPSTPPEWLEIERVLSARWNFHHCCGAIDGKHVRIVKPKRSGSDYYCHKGFFSIILLALVDAKYKFIWANVGSPGSECDCGVFNESNLEPALREGTLGLPDPTLLPGDNRDIPYFLVGDDAFPPRKYMVKPYSQRYLDHSQDIFNYRCSRARRVVENAFGILSARWRCLHTPLHIQPENGTAVVKCMLVLHNIMRDRYPQAQNADILGEAEGQPGAWRDHEVLLDVEHEGRGPRASREGKELRAYLRHYYNSPVGSVPWQEAALER